MHIRSRSHVYQLPKNDSDWNVPEIVKAANGYIYNSLRWLEMKTYSHQAVLSSDEDASYDIEFHSLSGRFTNYGAPQRLQKQSSMQKGFIWARQLKKSLLKKVNPTTLPPLPVTPVQLQCAPKLSRALSCVPFETAPRTRRTYGCRCASSPRSTRTI